MRTLVTLALAGVALALASGAAAQSPPPPARAVTPTQVAPDASLAARKEEAITRFQRGIELHRQGEYDAALSELRRAYVLAPAYQVLFNIGQVCYELKDYACALTSLRSYLGEGGSEIPPQRRAAVEADVAQLEPRVAAVEIDSNVQGAEIRVDDVRVGVTPLREPVIINPGRRRIAATKDRFVHALRVVDVVGAQSSQLTLTLVPSTPRPEGNRHPLVPVVAAPDSTRPGWTALSWAGLGITAALATGAATTGVLAWSAEADAKGTRFAGRSVSDEVQSDHQRAKGLALTADILTLAAVGALATTLVLTFTHRADPTMDHAKHPTATPLPEVSFGVSPRGAALGGSF